MILERTIALFPIELSEKISQLARSVCIIEVQPSRTYGTGFLISPNFVLTASHVALPWGDIRSDGTYSADFERSTETSLGTMSPILDAAPYPWSEAAASELHRLLADAYPTTATRLNVLRLAGIPRRHLLDQGTPFETWRQALDVAAGLKRLRVLVDEVKKDETTLAYHAKLDELLAERAIFPAKLFAVDEKLGWAVLRLERSALLPPLILGDPSMLTPGSALACIQHPHGHKQFALEPDGLIGLTDAEVHYRLDTLGGSSGAPVFDSSMKVVAIHRRANRDDRAGPPFNAGARMDAVKRGLEAARVDYLDHSHANEDAEHRDF